ncbi:MAG: hypothetical protein C0391_04380 [Anaerolinea sp.]|nr:hypothetical protein [Anaerolinea sp.]
MIELKILLLGTPIILWRDQPLLIKRRIPRAILYYLAAQEQPVGRGELLGLLWPEEPPEMARAYFRDNLSRLRTSLPDPSLLRAEINKVYLDPARTWVDIKEYHRVNRRANEALWNISSDLPIPEALYKEMAYAEGLWRSNRMLAGVDLPNTVEYETWVGNLEKRELRNHILILERLAAHCSVVGDRGWRIQWLYTLVDIDPYNEDYHIGIMEALQQLGNPREAYRYGLEVQERYQKDLNSLPSAKFNAIVGEFASSHGDKVAS